MALIELKNIHKNFIMGEENIHALNAINLSINEGDLRPASRGGKKTGIVGKQAGLGTQGTDVDTVVSLHW